MRNINRSLLSIAFSFALVLMGLSAGQAQEQPPNPSAARPFSIPAVKESKLKNGLTVAVVERPAYPLVTVHLLIKSGAADEQASKAGLANFTAEMLTKGTKTRTASQIAEDIEFLGSSISSGAGWQNSFVSLTTTPDKLDKAMLIMSDVALQPTFAASELDLLRSQSLDSLTYNLKQPGFLANYVASKVSYGEHWLAGTPDTLKTITPADTAAFYGTHFRPSNAVLIFVGDITAKNASQIAEWNFGKWKDPASGAAAPVKTAAPVASRRNTKDLDRIIVVDLPNSGQAAVSYTRRLAVGRTTGLGRGKVATSPTYYPSQVLNSILGGGYSSRLNQEIRIKRGLSYGAGSSFNWRDEYGNFSTSAQTKNESAAEVATLVMAELGRIAKSPITTEEMGPRKSVLTGGFGRTMESTAGIARSLADLYTFGIPTGELNNFIGRVNGVRDAQIRDFATRNLLGGDLVIVGDYSVFKDDLAKRFPGKKVTVYRAASLDLNSL